MSCAQLLPGAGGWAPCLCSKTTRLVSWHTSHFQGDFPKHQSMKRAALEIRKAKFPVLLLTLLFLFFHLVLILKNYGYRITLFCCSFEKL